MCVCPHVLEGGREERCYFCSFSQKHAGNTTPNNNKAAVSATCRYPSLDFPPFWCLWAVLGFNVPTQPCLGTGSHQVWGLCDPRAMHLPVGGWEGGGAEAFKLLTCECSERAELGGATQIPACHLLWCHPSPVPRRHTAMSTWEGSRCCSCCLGSAGMLPQHACSPPWPCAPPPPAAVPAPISIHLGLDKSKRL